MTMDDDTANRLKASGDGPEEPLQSLEEFAKASLNLLEDFNLERSRLEEMQRATFNILEDSNADKQRLEEMQRATLNILEDFESEKTKVEAINQTLSAEIAERKYAEERIKKLNEELEGHASQLTAAYEELEAFAHSVSHDLRAPLRAIDGFSRIVLDEYAKRLDAEGNRLLNIICANTQKMDQLITDLLDLSRVNRNEMKLSRIDMTKLANSIYHEIALPEVQKQFSFSVAALPDAYCDPTLVRQVWSNLISNAIKFTTPKDVRRIEIGGGMEKGVCTYFIKDTGVGFDPKYTHKIFGVFQRLHKAEEFEGTGVGLAIVQRIIHRHGGKVWAEGKVGEGATFWFSLPNRQ